MIVILQVAIAEFLAMTKSTVRKVWERACVHLESRWANCADARDRSGRKVSPYSEAAVKFSPWGTFMRGSREIMGETDKQREFVEAWRWPLWTDLALTNACRSVRPELLEALKEFAREC